MAANNSRMAAALIGGLELSTRTLYILLRAHIQSIQELNKMTDEELLSIRNFGPKTLAEVRQKLRDYRGG